MRFNENRFALEYDRRLSEEGYPGILLDEVASGLAGFRHVIDVGAGTGNFAIPLAAMGHQITAIEPSGAMLEIFTGKIPPHLAPMIRLCAGDWESWEGEKGDALICVHAIYGMSDIARALEKMKRLSGRTLLLVKADNGSRTLSEIIRNELRRQRCSAGFSAGVEHALDGIGIPYSVRPVRQVRTSFFADLGEEADYYRYHLGLDTGLAGTIRGIIASHASPSPGGYSFEAVYCDRLFTF